MASYKNKFGFIDLDVGHLWAGWSYWAGNQYGSKTCILNKTLHVRCCTHGGETLAYHI